MIQSKSDYLYYLEADRIALQRNRKKTLKTFIKELYWPDYIWKFEKLLRKVEYYKNCKHDLFSRIRLKFLYYKFYGLSVKLGFTIPGNVIGPGLVIAHYGTIVITYRAKIGANLKIHASTNIGVSNGKAPIIGDNCYIGPGAKIYGGITIGDNVVIGANSVVNKSFDNNIIIAGVPAKEIGINNRNLIIKATNFLDQGLDDKEIQKIIANEKIVSAG
jgi:serine O-acetyltransferase